MEIHWSPAPAQLLRLHQAYAGPKSLVEKLNRAGFEAYLVGGAVRDAILGRPISDWDIATSADPQAMLSIWPRAVPVGIQHGTLLVTEVTPPVEITAFRTEGPYKDQRHPDWVSFGVDLGEDLKRRDFTINALAFDPVKERLADPTGGLADLERGLIRAVGNPDERFREDALRLLRAVRFAATLEFELEPKTKAALSKQADGLKRVAPERIREELLKLLKAERPSRGFRAMKEAGLLVHVLPELLEGLEMTQNSYHAHTVFDHILHAVDAAPRDNLRVRLGALFHDIAKPRTQGGVEGERTFYNHEGVGSKLTQEIMTRLRFPKREIEYVSGLVRNHMFHYTDEWSDGTVRRFVNRVGRDSLPDLFALRHADNEGSGTRPRTSPRLEELKERVDRVIQEDDALDLSALEITGTDLMESLSLAPGPEVGKLLKHLLDVVLENPERNSREVLLEIAREKHKSA